MAHAEAGGYFAVPNVQELAQACNASEGQLPERYIREEDGAADVADGRDFSSAIPIVDLSKLLDPQSSKDECLKLGSACEKWGFFQILSNGKYRSVEHRAVVHPTRERMSAAVFHHPRHDAIIGPLSELVKDGGARYSSMDYMDFRKRFFAAKLGGRGLIESLRS